MGYGRLRGTLINVTNWPAAIPNTEPDSPTSIRGQVLDFIDYDGTAWHKIISRYDHYEATPDLFDRDIVDVQLDGGTTIKAWMYWYVDPCSIKGLPVVPDGDWKNIIKGDGDQ